MRNIGMVRKNGSPKHCAQQVGRFLSKGFRWFRRVRPTIIWVLFTKRHFLINWRIFLRQLFLARMSGARSSWEAAPSPGDDVESGGRELEADFDAGFEPIFE